MPSDASNPFNEVTHTLFSRKEVLKEDYQPDQILERDQEIAAYRDALSDVLFGRSPPNIFVYGKTGVGKTVVTRYILDALEEEAESRESADDLTVLFGNCTNESTYSILRRHINQLKAPTEKPFPKRGLSTRDALDAFYEHLDDHGGSFLLVLDEIDHLKDLDNLLYELPRARSNGHITNARVGIIGISNDYTFRNRLSAKVKSSLREEEISFTPYDANQLRTILEHRAALAFVDGACDESALSLSAGLAARDSGNARQALDLLLTGGVLAERAEDEVVRDTHIEAASKEVERGHLKNKIQDQTIHTQYVLEAVARLDVIEDLPARSKTIQSTYEDVANHWGDSPLQSLKSVQNHLSELSMLGFLTMNDRNSGRSGGRFYEYDLDFDAETVFEVRQELEQKRSLE
ncbi:Cdc6/Cdc18 family protein [Haladaptatus sp. DYSN1]|uniref:Cdc6/Cdc18 family protein n=1 Tax=unclassified Haladaptatus TaxID=2622732 RepID=UPI002406CC4E|nr:orc1/cdc6 family replication initiation protein [Haladaptatus sp. DYSN1]